MTAPTTRAIVESILRRELPPGVTSWDDPRNVAALKASDKGGWTRGGITAESWGRYRRLECDATPNELNAITTNEAFTFYRDQYVRPFAFVDDPLRLMLVDFGVTSHHRSVYRALQFGLKYQGLYGGVIDGLVGPKTRAALAAVRDHRKLYDEVLDQRRRYYEALALDRPARAFLRATPHTQLHNLRGWTNRCAEFVGLMPDRPRLGNVVNNLHRSMNAEGG